MKNGLHIARWQAVFFMTTVKALWSLQTRSTFAVQVDLAAHKGIALANAHNVHTPGIS